MASIEQYDETQCVGKKRKRVMNSVIPTMEVKDVRWALKNMRNLYSSSTAEKPLHISEMLTHDMTLETFAFEFVKRHHAKRSFRFRQQRMQQQQQHQHHTHHTQHSQHPPHQQHHQHQHMYQLQHPSSPPLQFQPQMQSQMQTQIQPHLPIQPYFHVHNSYPYQSLPLPETANISNIPTMYHPYPTYPLNPHTPIYLTGPHSTIQRQSMEMGPTSENTTLSQTIQSFDTVNN